MKHVILRHKLLLIGLLMGGIAGYLYYLFIGCSSGSCAITSRPLNSTLYGALMGALVLDSFKKKEKQ
jgi:phage shock protein E